MLAAVGTIKSITALILAVFLQLGMNGAVDEVPQDAAIEFMNGVSQQQTQIMNMHMGNDYINFINNVEGDKETTDRLRENLLKNFSYEIEAVEERDDLAVAKVRIKGNDFSKAMEKYEEASYEYVTTNLYDDSVEDKAALQKKCLEIYVDQIEDTAKNGKIHENTIYLPMKCDKSGVWNVMLSDEIMKAILGNISLPDNVINKAELKEQ